MYQLPVLRSWRAIALACYNYFTGIGLSRLTKCIWKGIRPGEHTNSIQDSLIPEFHDFP